MAITFTKVGTNKVRINDGTKVVAGLSIYTNVFEHPSQDAVILSNDCDVINTLNSSLNGLTINVADVTTPSCTDKSDLATKLTLSYFN